LLDFLVLGDDLFLEVCHGVDIEAKEAGALFIYRKPGTGTTSAVVYF
jgi:hypothetical protein